MQTKTALFLTIAFMTIASTNVYANENNNQQIIQIVRGDTAPANNQTGDKMPTDEDINKTIAQEAGREKAILTFADSTDDTTKKNPGLKTTKKTQTIRGLFTLGGFNKNENDKNKKTGTHYEK